MEDNCSSPLIITHIAEYFSFAKKSSNTSFLDLAIRTFQKLDKLTISDRRLSRKIRSLEEGLNQAIALNDNVETITLLGKEYEKKQIYLREIREALKLFNFSISSSALLLYPKIFSSSKTVFLKQKLFNTDVLSQLERSVTSRESKHPRVYIKNILVDEHFIVLSTDIDNRNRLITIQHKEMRVVKKKVRHE
jgi:hypothetical protein